ncbi:MAG: hypothetical protein NT027_02665, partial [Proteobacteria bacterium]|nr:hypothetical protein [Pseudomonadota bacterium]
WTLKSNLVSLPLIKDIAVQENGVLKVSAYDHSPKGIFRAWGTKAEGSFLAQVRVDRKALHDVPPPFIIEIDQFKDLNLQKSWGWLKQNQGNLGVFLDISRVKKGVYDFALDLMLSHRANDDFNDFSSIDWDWSDLR